MCRSDWRLAGAVRCHIDTDGRHLWTIAISLKRMRRSQPSRLQQKCPYDKNDDPSNQPNDVDCCGDAGSAIREKRR